MDVLIIKDLKKTYQSKDSLVKTEALKGVSLEIRAGEIFGLLGPNGAGKTTLINTITTLEKPTEGEVMVFGKSVVHDPMFTKKKIGVVHQEVINTGFFSIEEILKFQSGYYGIKNNLERINYLLEKLSLTPHRQKKVKQLSGGMKRRLMIAKALVHSPKLLLLDEPTAGVDVELRESLWKFVLELKASGVSILLTTHYLEEAEKLCDRVSIINKGNLIYTGKPREVIEKYSTKKIYLKTSSGQTHTLVDSAAKSIQDILKEHHISFSDIVDIQIEEGRLEEAFTKMVNL
ncbi:MAG: ABC transporter ATP-binding protein [Moraxellaceae bacterium]|nr:ABC transporter ATP-binding protein [Pseudobdellovibrionaceae bacterium]